MAIVQSWGRLPSAPHELLAPLRERGAALPPGRAGHAMLPFGNGRSYGDVCLNPGGGLWPTRGLDRFIAFDPATGVLDCEAGVLLDEIIRLALPRGWFLPVTPGTRFVTVGGAIANDVHGKNHHRAGTLGHHVLSLELLRTDGQRLDCSADRHADWLAATVGGLGLTGVITRARLQLAPVPGEWLQVRTEVFESLPEFFQRSRAAEAGYDYVVAWIDCCTAQPRGALFMARHAPRDASHDAPAPRPRPRRVPVTPPVSLINGLSLKAFNSLYFQRQRARQGVRLQHWEPFFYPLDGLLEWNRIYGPRGFYQYQCVLPRRDELEGTAALLRAISAAGRGSFLAVLKTFGDRPAAGMLSFPMAGATLALDFPNQGAGTLALFDRLDAIVSEAGGRLYPAKDARMSSRLFAQGYPAWQDFQRFRDPGIASAMSRRLLDPLIP